MMNFRSTLNCPPKSDSHDAGGHPGNEGNPRFISGDIPKIRTSGFIIKVARTITETSIFPNIPSFQSHLPSINSSPLPLLLNPFNTHRIPSYPPYLACPSFSGYIHEEQHFCSSVEKKCHEETKAQRSLEEKINILLGVFETLCQKSVF